MTKVLTAKALEKAILSATSLEELKMLVSHQDASSVMNSDGTIRGVVFCKPSKTRGSVLQIAIGRGRPEGVKTSLVVDGKDIRAVYREAVGIVAAHYKISENVDLVQRMNASIDAFLAKYKLKLTEVRYETVFRAD